MNEVIERATEGYGKEENTAPESGRNTVLSGVTTPLAVPKLNPPSVTTCIMLSRRIT